MSHRFICSLPGGLEIIQWILLQICSWWEIMEWGWKLLSQFCTCKHNRQLSFSRRWCYQYVPFNIDIWRRGLDRRPARWCWCMELVWWKKLELYLLGNRQGWYSILIKESKDFILLLMNSWVSPLTTGQPNNGGGIQKFISTNFGADGKWNDNNGNSIRPSVCQYYTGIKY